MVEPRLTFSTMADWRWVLSVWSIGKARTWPSRSRSPRTGCLPTGPRPPPPWASAAGPDHYFRHLRLGGLPRSPCSSPPPTSPVAPAGAQIALRIAPCSLPRQKFLMRWAGPSTRAFLCSQFEQVVAGDQRPFAVHLLQSTPGNPRPCLIWPNTAPQHPQSVALPTPPGL